MIIDRLPYDHENPARYRQELDRALAVTTWPVPGTARASRRRREEPRAPAWWEGDEEASQTFLRSMGVLT